MRLYAGPLSLFSRKVEIALHEKGLAFERVMVPFTQTRGYSPRHPDVLAANPKGQVPVLADSDLALYDSTVILEYLEDAHPAPPLYPAAPAERARCRLREVFADEVMLTPLRALMHRTEPREAAPERWDASEARAEAAGRVLEDQLGALDRDLRDRDYLCGDLSAADIATFMSVLYVQRLGGPRLDGHPALARWFERLLRREAFARVAAEILAADGELSAPVEAARGNKYLEPAAAPGRNV